MKHENKHIKGLLVDYITGEISLEEKEMVKDWLTSSPENQRYYEQIRQTYKASIIGTNYYHLNPDKAWRKFTRRLPVKNPLYHLHPLMRAAALIVIFFSLGYFAHEMLQQDNSISSGMIVSETPLGSKTKIVLVDGTQVWLNAGSKLTYPSSFEGDAREVELTGEGYFNVFTNKQKPFIVNASGVKVKALGTQFNVKAYEGEDKVETTLVEGVVEIENKSLNKTVTLIPNQKAIVTKNEFTTPTTEPEELSGLETPTPLEKKTSVNVKSDVETLVETSWKDPQWIIRNESLKDLAIKLERRYNVTIEFSSERLKDFKYSGTLEDESLEQVLQLISYTSPLSFLIEGKSVKFIEDIKKGKQFESVYTNN